MIYVLRTELHTLTVITPTIDHLQMYSYELTLSELFMNEIEIVVKHCTYIRTY